MTILVVDDEEIILQGMVRTIKAVEGEDITIYTAQDPYSAIEIMKKNPIDIVFSDVEMPGMNGLQLAGEIHDINPEADIVFATGYSHYSLEAWKTVAKGFLVKPVTDFDVRKTMDKLKQFHINNDASDKLYKKVDTDDRIEARCFGNFELFYHGKIIFFSRKKSKEMIAYLLDRRGAMISTAEIRTILWEDEADSDEKKGYVRVLANDIRKSIKAIGLDDVLINNADGYALDLSKFKCDYLDFLSGKKKALNSFNEEYMTQYYWGETTLSGLLEHSY